jgi:hypothetical protein
MNLILLVQLLSVAILMHGKISKNLISGATRPIILCLMVMEYEDWLTYRIVTTLDCITDAVFYAL